MDTHPGQWVICIGVALCVLLLEELVKVGHRWGSRARRMRRCPSHEAGIA